jgi:predicted DCC family thiol-disulfide oxidoreductase YuxK
VIEKPALALLFDGRCGVCTRLARWVQRRERSGRLLVVANQETGVLARFGVSREEAARAAWAIDSKGRRFEGAAALNRVLTELGGGWLMLAALYGVPPLGAAENALYRWFARRRGRFGRFGVTPECDRPGSDCD